MDSKIDKHYKQGSIEPIDYIIANNLNSVISYFVTILLSGAVTSKI